MTRHVRSTEAQDHNVLTIFLPIVAVAIAVCAAGCFYMEKRRKKKLKKGGRGGGEYLDDHISDTASVISTASSRHRPYMLPTPTTGRTYRTPSRAGSLRGSSTGSLRGAYDFDSSYGEPPPYSGRNSRRSSVASSKALQENAYRKGAFNDGFMSSEQSLSRSKSMLDVRNDFDSMPPLRRTRSSSSLQDPYRENYPEMSRYGDELSSQRSRQGSPSLSEWSIRTAPQMSAYERDYVPGRPSSVSSLPTRGRRSSMRRSLSQPNLSRSLLTKTGTYPQGILKRNGGAMSDDGRSSYHAASDSGIKDYGDADSGRASQMDEGARPSTRPPSVYGSARGGRYDGYYADSNSGAYPTYPGHRGQGAFNDDPAYNANGSGQYPHYGQNSRDWGSQQQYPPSYDPYNYGGNYWDPQNGAAPQPHNPYVYGSMIY